MTRTLDVRDTRTAIDVTGDGPPLVLMHGAEGSRRSFAPLVPLLAGRFTVITYDQRDCGDTVGPETPATLATLADDAAALLEALGHPQAHVFGTSFGGRVAQAFAARHPRAVRRLVLASTWPLPVALADAHGETARVLAGLRAGLPDTAERLAEYFYPEAFLAERPEYRRHFKAAPPRSARSERRAAAIADRPDIDLGRIGCPTLLVVGDADRVVPATLTLQLADHLRDTRAVTLPGVGHLSYVQAPALLAGHLHDFLGNPGELR